MRDQVAVARRRFGAAGGGRHTDRHGEKRRFGPPGPAQEKHDDRQKQSPSVALRCRRRRSTEAKDGPGQCSRPLRAVTRSEEHTSELQSLMRISYADFCLKKKKKQTTQTS